MIFNLFVQIHSQAHILDSIRTLLNILKLILFHSQRRTVSHIAKFIHKIPYATYGPGFKLHKHELGCARTGISTQVSTRPYNWTKLFFNETVAVETWNWIDELLCGSVEVGLTLLSSDFCLRRNKSKSAISKCVMRKKSCIWARKS